MNECPRVAFKAINARYPQIKWRDFVASSDLGLPVFYVQEAGEIGSDVLGEGIKSRDASILEPCRRRIEGRRYSLPAHHRRAPGISKGDISAVGENVLGGFRVAFGKLIYRLMKPADDL